MAALTNRVASYARNDELGLVIGYEDEGEPHVYRPDFLVRLTDGRTVILETKGYATDQDLAKHTAARRWASVVNHWGQLGTWAFPACYGPQQIESNICSL
jgi:type III restriction enzyme